MYYTEKTTIFNNDHKTRIEIKPVIISLIIIGLVNIT